MALSHVMLYSDLRNLSCAGNSSLIYNIFEILPPTTECSYPFRFSCVGNKINNIKTFENDVK